VRATAILCAGALLVPLVVAVPTSAATTHAAGQPVPINDCWTNVLGVPTLTSFSLTRSVNTASGNKQVRFTVHADDKGAGAPGIGRVDLQLTPPDSPYPARSLELTHRSGDTWTGSATFTPWEAHVGKWHVVFLELVGKTVKNSLGFPADRAYNEARLAKIGPTTFTVAAPHPDSTKPTLHAFFHTPDNVNTKSSRKTVTFQARASDTGSGVATVVVDFADEGQQRFWPFPDPQFPLHLKRVAGTHKFRGQLTVPKWIIGSDQFTFYATVTDRAGNQHAYGFGGSSSVQDFDGTLGVVAHRYNKSPTATFSTSLVSPTHADVRTDSHRVTVTTHVTLAAPTPKIDTITVNEGWPDQGPTTVSTGTLHRVSGTARNGVWRGTIVIHHCTARRSDDHLVLAAFSNHQLTGTKDVPIHIRVSDHFPPRFKVHPSGGAPTDPISVEFNEDVAGLTDKTMVVQQQDGSQPNAHARQPGTWACATTAGTSVSCYRGPVRSATFTPEDPIPAGEYEIISDPGNQHGLTDEAGNPSYFGDRYGVGTG
jgi:hypothetical protein